MVDKQLCSSVVRATTGAKNENARKKAFPCTLSVDETHFSRKSGLSPSPPAAENPGLDTTPAGSRPYECDSPSLTDDNNKALSLRSLSLFVGVVNNKRLTRPKSPARSLGGT